MAGLPAAGIAGTPPTAGDVTTHLPRWLEHAELAAERLAPADDWFETALKDLIIRQAGRVAARQKRRERAIRNALLAAALAEARPASLKDLLAAGGGISGVWRRASRELKAAIRARLAVNAAGAEPPLTYSAHSRYWWAAMRVRKDPGRFLDIDLAAPEFAEMPADLLRRLVATQLEIDANG